MNSVVHSAPWYRHRWPWILMAGPAAAVVAGAVTLWLAIKSNDGLVADDYYKQGLAINQDLARVERAGALGLRGEARIGEDRVVISLSSRDGLVPERIRVRIAHHTRAGLDQSLLLAGTGNYTGALAPLTPGRWQVEVSDEANTWRLGGVLRFPQDQQLTMSATAP